MKGGKESLAHTDPLILILILIHTERRPVLACVPCGISVRHRHCWCLGSPAMEEEIRKEVRRMIAAVIEIETMMIRPTHRIRA